MIIGRCFGGLGNQLFCYAAAKSLAQKTGRKLYLDLHSGFKRDFFKRTPEISLFNVPYKEAGYWQSFQFPGGVKVTTALRSLTLKNNWLHKYYYHERDLAHFDPAFFDQPKSGFIYLDGYWQSEKYFESIAPLIRQEFEMLDNHDNENREWAEKIRNTNAVALHARRLHGVPNQQKAQPIKGIRSVSLQYYIDCMNEISSKIENPHFYCFSDYPEWFEEKLKTSHNITFITHNKYGENRSHEDFWLMSLCKHFIISNSTFSWWAAWLSVYNDKIIFAPDLSLWECKDIIPSSWQIRNASHL